MDGIFNLSAKTLTRHHVKLLQKGLKYAPTKKLNKFEVYVDLQKFKRKLALKKYFHKTAIEKEANEDLNFVHTTLKTKSTFYPKHMLSREITTFEIMVLKDLDKLEKKCNRTNSNLTKQEKEALEDLQNDDSIVVKPADKGGGVVILSKEYYVKEAERILGDIGTYEVLKGDHVSLALIE